MCALTLLAALAASWTLASCAPSRAAVLVTVRCRTDPCYRWIETCVSYRNTGTAILSLLVPSAFANRVMARFSVQCATLFFWASSACLAAQAYVTRL